jgi:hypothetical protein
MGEKNYHCRKYTGTMVENIQERWKKKKRKLEENIQKQW